MGLGKCKQCLGGTGKNGRVDSKAHENDCRNEGTADCLATQASIVFLGLDVNVKTVSIFAQFSLWIVESTHPQLVPLLLVLSSMEEIVLGGKR